MFETLPLIQILSGTTLSEKRNYRFGIRLGLEIANPPPQNRRNPHRQQQAIYELNGDEIFDVSTKADTKANTDGKPPL
jgi:hypothetical protein